MYLLSTGNLVYLLVVSTTIINPMTNQHTILYLYIDYLSTTILATMATCMNLCCSILLIYKLKIQYKYDVHYLVHPNI